MTGLHLPADRWVGLAKLAEETGLAVRTLQYIAQREPGVLVVRDGTRGREFKQPDCAVNLRAREYERGKEDAKKTLPDTGRQRHEAAKADLLELELAQQRGELATKSQFRDAFASACHRVRVRLVALPARLAPLVLGAQTVQEALARIEPLVHEAVDELRRGDDVPDTPASPPSVTAA